MSEQLFEQATRKKLRFSFCGNIGVEDLWDLSLQDLDTMFRSYNADLKRQNEEESLLEPRTRTQDDTSLRVDILRYIVQVKLAEAAAAQEAASRKQKKQRIMEIMAKKEDESLEGMSTDELAKMLDEL